MNEKKPLNSKLYLGEPNKIIMTKVAGKVVIPGMKDIAAWACDCICYCNCDCVAPLCDCSVCNCDCDCQTPNQDIRETLVKSGIDAKNLNAKYGQVVEILKNIK